MKVLELKKQQQKTINVFHEGLDNAFFRKGKHSLAES